MLMHELGSLWLCGRVYVQSYFPRSANVHDAAAKLAYVACNVRQLVTKVGGNAAHWFREDCGPIRVNGTTSSSFGQLVDWDGNISKGKRRIRFGTAPPVHAAQ
jgi:hypothetical protein